MTEIKIKKKAISAFWSEVAWRSNSLLTFLSLRNSRKFWGVVYDSVSKQPLDPVIVKLVYAQSGEPVQTCVTDLAGRYGFLAQPGKFKIFAKKSNYLFPSVKILAKDDGIFTDVYRGEFFELFSESEVVGPNIPMDPLTQDWNQAAKLKVLNTFPYLKLFFKKFVKTFFWFGFILTLIFVFKDFYETLWFQSFGPAEKVFLAYVLLLLLDYFLPQVRLWGRIVDQHNRPLSKVSLEVVNPLISSIVFAKYQTAEDGRFLLRANPGKYILRCHYKGSLVDTHISVGKIGVINSTFKLVDK
jgi:hypothetical protein